MINIEKSIVLQKNEALANQKNNTLVGQQNENVAKYDYSETNRKKPKTRQISTDGPVTSVPTMMDNMNAEQSFYQSPLMVYPFPMMNTYYPRYFPYTYPGYQGHPFFG